MMEFFSQDNLMAFFEAYAYKPMFVYMFVTLFMFASSFGFPIPEEIVLLTSGLVAYMALHPALYPPPTPDAVGVDLTTLCIVSFFAVFLSDFLVYLIGKFFGGKIIKTRFFQKQVAGQSFDRINSWFQKYGAFAAGIFRFTPGLRFPGHMSCGLLGLPMWKFIAVDGTAALLSVPTQVYLIAVYGGSILAKFAEFKRYLLIGLGVFLLGWLAYKLIKKISNQNSAKNL